MIGVAVLQECFAHGNEILAIVRPNSRNMNRIPKSPLITLCECEIENLEELDVTAYGYDWDVFYHFAWNSLAPAGRDNVDLQMRNIQCTLSSVKLAKRLGCHKFIGAGSQAEYGTYRMGRIGPDTPTNPIDAYGIAKFASGKLAMVMAQQTGIDFFWVRVFSVFGPYDRITSLVNSTIEKMLQNERPQFTRATQIWDYLYSGDAGQAFYLIGEKGKGIRTYCLGSGQSRPLIEYIRIIRDIINPDLELGIGELPYVGAPINIDPDISSLSSDVGFLPGTTFEEGIRQILSSSAFRQTTRA